MTSSQKVTGNWFPMPNEDRYGKGRKRIGSEGSGGVEELSMRINFFLLGFPLQSGGPGNIYLSSTQTLECVSLRQGQVFLF